MTIFEKDNFDFLDKKTRQILLASRESFVPHTPYRYEKDMLEAVRIGDMDLAKQCMEALEKTVEWYKAYLAGEDMRAVTDRQIEAFFG